MSKLWDTDTTCIESCLIGTRGIMTVAVWWRKVLQTFPQLSENLFSKKLVVCSVYDTHLHLYLKQDNDSIIIMTVTALCLLLLFIWCPLFRWPDPAAVQYPVRLQGRVHRGAQGWNLQPVWGRWEHQCSGERGNWTWYLIHPARVQEGFFDKHKNIFILTRVRR